MAAFNRDALASWRRRTGLTQGALAADAKLDRSYINRLESGDRDDPSSDVVIRIAQALATAFLALRSKQVGPSAANPSELPRLTDRIMRALNGEDVGAAIAIKTSDARTGGDGDSQSGLRLHEELLRLGVQGRPEIAAMGLDHHVAVDDIVELWRMPGKEGWGLRVEEIVVVPDTAEPKLPAYVRRAKSQSKAPDWNSDLGFVTECRPPISDVGGTLDLRLADGDWHLKECIEDCRDKMLASPDVVYEPRLRGLSK